MKKALAFNDVLIAPGWSTINSRKEVSLETTFMGEKLTLPILSAHMDTVTNANLAIELHKAGGLATLHRFQSIGDNIKEFITVQNASSRSPIVSVGLQDQERLDALINAGANKVLLDVAHGGMKSVAEWLFKTTDKYPDLWIMVGNFATVQQIEMVVYESNQESNERLTWRVGVGSGSGCTTRIKTGCGLPTLASLLEMKNTLPEEVLVGDGGFKNPGDIAKGVAAGANVVMLGSMLAGTDESPGEVIRGAIRLSGNFEEFPKHWDKYSDEECLNNIAALRKALYLNEDSVSKVKRFRGSAAASSYKDQGKEWACAEGEEFLIPHKGPVSNVLNEIEGGLRSALTYVGARNLTEFREDATLVEITNNGWLESGAHGKGK